MSHKKNIGLISHTSVTKHSDNGNYLNKKTKYSKLLEDSRYSAYKKIIEDNNIDYNTIIDVGCSWGSYFYFYNSLFNKPKIIGIEQYDIAAKEAEKISFDTEELVFHATDFAKGAARVAAGKHVCTPTSVWNTLLNFSFCRNCVSSGARRASFSGFGDECTES